MSGECAAILPLPAGIADAAFAPLAGETPVVRVARTLLDTAVVAAAEPLIGRVREVLATQGLSAITVVGADDPGSRAQCLAAALRPLAGQRCHIVIHDVRRPLAPTSLRDNVIEALHAGGSVVMPMMPLTDSVKAVNAQGTVVGTLERSMLRAVQYPRGFTVDKLFELLAGRTSDDFDELDESLRTGTAITAVDGDPDAFVVELPRDSPYLEALIACR